MKEKNYKNQLLMIQLEEKSIEMYNDKKQMEELTNLGQELSKDRLIWLSGFFSGQAEANSKLAELFQRLGNNGKVPVLPETNQFPQKPIVDKLPVATRQLTILYGSHSGNGAGFSKLAKEIAEKKGFQIKLQNMNDYKVRDLKNEQNLLIIVSTHGEGEPPLSAEELHEYIFSDRAPELPKLKYSVLALGDKSYFHFCKTGFEFDQRLEELGAKRISKRVDCDVNFKNDAATWLSDSLQVFDSIIKGNNQDFQAKSEGGVQSKNQLSTNDENFTHFAEIQNKIKLNGRGSEKETYHIELLINSSDIKYEPGDAVGVKSSNSDELVKKVLEALTFTGNEIVQTQKGNLTMKDSLKNEFELTTLNVETVKKHQEKINNEDLAKIIDDQELFKNFISQNDVLDMIQQFPAEYTAREFVNIMRPIAARLYSIASSQKSYEDEIHITVEAIRKTNNGRTKYGCCSTFFADHLNLGDKVAIYIKPNEGFRLPVNDSLPVIMIGAGTGIAPFRSFVEDRAQSGAKGKNWLIFGHQHFTTDFLYQTEWQNHLKSGALSKLTLAFSRDQEEKVYVQHKILEHGKEIYEWLNSNACVYVCGDKKNMAGGVYQAFVEVIQKEAALAEDEARAYIKNLKKKGLYLEDVY